MIVFKQSRSVGFAAACVHMERQKQVLMAQGMSENDALIKIFEKKGYIINIFLIAISNVSYMCKG